LGFEPDFLTVDEVLSLHREQILLFGGTVGVRDIAALESAVATPAATFDGMYLHADLFEMAAAYAFHLAENQPFLDGNKRVGLSAALVFLDINGWVVLDPLSELYDAMLGMSSGAVDKTRMAQILRALAVRLDEHVDES
jgi:death-on-curing protein